MHAESVSILFNNRKYRRNVARTRSALNFSRNYLANACVQQEQFSLVEAFPLSLKYCLMVLVIVAQGLSHKRLPSLAIELVAVHFRNWCLLGVFSRTICFILASHRIDIT